jgi:hypothetical protein
MSNFENREKSFEKKFVLDEEVKFKIEARRNKLIGEWVSDIFGYSESQREAYIQAVIASDVFEKVKNDLEGKNISDEDLRKKMNEFFEIAKSSIK